MGHYIIYADDLRNEKKSWTARNSIERRRMEDRLRAAGYRHVESTYIRQK